MWGYRRPKCRKGIERALQCTIDKSIPTLSSPPLHHSPTNNQPPTMPGQHFRPYIGDDPTADTTLGINVLVLEMYRYDGTDDRSGTCCLAWPAVGRGARNPGKCIGNAFSWSSMFAGCVMYKGMRKPQGVGAGEVLLLGS